MATIRDVAEQAGVSVATVSRVLNDNGYVGAETRKRVMAAIEGLNYSPNEVARSLYKRESRLIGLLLPDITNPFFPQLARGIEDEVHRAGFRLLLGNSDEEASKELEYIQTFLQNQVVGIMSATNNTDSENYTNLDLPVVFLDRVSKQHPSVYADGIEGGRLAARTLVERGSKRITLIKGPGHIQPAMDRFQGALAVLSEAEVDFSVLSTSSYAFDDARTWAEELFAKYPDTDGVIASNDIVAIAILHEALRLGRRIPDDLQLIGYDDIPFSSLSYPSLSTIRQPAYEMGKEAAKLLIRMIQKEKEVEQTIQLPVTLIERNTTRKVDPNA
ncbi:LacI family DNA-binding transcriptional regulator [Pseudalkalibacillus hwajinpoensis]|uniref:LacI family DNA-binding transcriptional regulator n=1 Tax=Guptibacillus hwajinpoensis TaxID=208199 RepID=UPI001CFDA919|nr:LacI family DNA-binding transcriptional regulator [Pseudalkalibacillus hwajinpoensis]